MKALNIIKISILLALTSSAAAFAGKTDVSLQAHADYNSDLALVRTLAPQGYDVAQIQGAILQGISPDEATAYGEMNFLVRDINADGIADILAIFEENPLLLDDNGQSCPEQNYEVGCRIDYGPRVIQFWQGSGGGQFVKVSENSAIALGAAEGGVFGDPLNGFEVRQNGTIVFSVYGGSAWRWSFAYTFQFRSNDLYLIGTDDYSGWNGDLRFEKKSVNLLTGLVIESTSKGEGYKTHTKKYFIAKQPLASLAQVGDRAE